MLLKKSLEDYRKGGVGALMDEYERAAFELKSLLENVSEDDYVKIIDPDTEDSDCHSMQTIMNHVIYSGYGYANGMRRQFSIPHEPLGDERRQIQKAEIGGEIEKVLDYTVETLDGKWELSYDEMESIIIMKKENFSENLEQLLEHAVLHILRHRRQIEKFLLQV